MEVMFHPAALPSLSVELFVLKRDLLIIIIINTQVKSWPARTVPTEIFTSSIREAYQCVPRVNAVTTPVRLPKVRQN